jgi:hypothetical protein
MPVGNQEDSDDEVKFTLSSYLAYLQSGGLKTTPIVKKNTIRTKRKPSVDVLTTPRSKVCVHVRTSVDVQTTSCFHVRVCACAHAYLRVC